jgi:toxin FitB
MIVLDTNAVSEPLKPLPNPQYMQWFGAQAIESLYLTSITVAEMLTGIAKMPAGKRRTSVQAGISKQVFPLFDGRVLNFDATAAATFAEVVVRANRVGNDIAFEDAAIAAIAVAHQFQLVTRNVRDFKGTGVTLINPWGEA